MKELVEYIAKSLVDHPDTVIVTEATADGRMVLTLKVEAADMGRVIGKQGRIAQAIRTLLKVAATRNDLPDRQPSLIITALNDGSELAVPPAARADESVDEHPGI